MAARADTETLPGHVGVGGERERTTFGVGTRLKHYEIIRKLGEGGMGAVYLARDVKLGRLVALKVLLEHGGLGGGRFLIEARATARCKHENIVDIYEVDEIDGTPYMILEYLEGRTLRDWMYAHTRTDADRSPAEESLSPLPLTPHAVMDVMIPVLRALDCAHQLGIVHRDLKPENIFMTHSGRVVVLDFGLAKQIDVKENPMAKSDVDPLIKGTGMTEDGALMGTLAYMSPEQWLGVDVDFRTDLWAVGVMLYELVTGKHPLAPITGYDLHIVGQLDQPVPSVTERRRDLGTLGLVIDRCLQKQKDERFASTREVLDALMPTLPGRQMLELREGESPFAGLSAFQESDAARFFGREHEIGALVSRLRNQRLAIVTGPSGAGKSSFVRAGVIPAFKRSGEQWDAYVMRPGHRPLEALADVIARATDEVVEANVGDEFRTEPGLAGARLRARCRAQDGHRHILLFVDQFEELYTLGADPSDQAAFIACLEGIADDASSPLRIILSIRSDFLDRLAHDRRLMNDVPAGLFFLPPMGRTALRDALTRPIEAVGYRFEDTDMIEALLDALENTPSPLPLLQFAAEKLWEARNRQRRLLTAESYENYRQAGGLGGALGRHADAVLAAMSDDERKLSRAALLRMVTPERTRAICTMRELCEIASQPDEMERVLGRLVDARLLSIETSGEAIRTIELVHESLLGGWPTLVTWLAENQADAVFLARLRTAAKEWQIAGRSTDLLWRGQAADTATRWHKDYAGEMSPLESDYLQAVEELGEQAKRSRRRVAAGIFTALTVIVVVVSILAIRADQAATAANKSFQQATEAEKRAKDKAIEASDARLLAGFRELKTIGQLALATKLLSAVERPRATRGWTALASDALAENALFATLHGHEKELTVAVWSHDGKHVLTAADDKTARVWNANGEGLPVVIRGHEGPIVAAAWSPDDMQLVTASRDTTARVWHADGKGEPVVLKGHEGPVTFAAWSPDGKHIVTASEDATARLFGADGREVMVHRGHTAGVTMAVFHPNGEQVISASNDKTIRVWHVHGNEPDIVQQSPEAAAAFVALSPDGSRILATSRDKNAYLFDTLGKDKPIALKGHEGSIEHAAWSSDGRYIVTGSSDRTARIWRPDGKGEPVVLAGHNQAITFVAFRPDGRYVVTASRDQTARIWPVEGGSSFELRGHGAPLRSAVWNPDGTHLLTAAGEGGRLPDATARIWRPTSLESLPRERPYFFHSAFLAANGETIIAAYDDGAARLGRVDGHDEPIVFKGHRDWITSAALSPDGRRVVTVSLDGTANIWDASGKGEPMTLVIHSAPIQAAAWSPDAKRVATASDDRTARIWDANGSGEMVIFGQGSGHSDGLTAVAWSPDGTRIVTTSMDHTAHVWNARGDDKPLVLKGHADVVNGAAFRADGKQILTYSEDGTARIWNADTGIQLATFDHNSPVLCARWSPDGQTIVTSSVKGGIHLWRADGRGERIQLESPAPVLAIVFLDQGKKIVTVAANNTTRVLTIDAAALKHGLTETNVDCLPETMRETYLGESQAKAAQLHAACECRHRRSLAPETCQDIMAAVDENEPTTTDSLGSENAPYATSSNVKPRPLLGQDERRVALVVLPGDASVEVDGQPVRRRNGVIDLVGKLGDTHRVRVFKGSKTTAEKSVMIQESGAIPARLDLRESLPTSAQKKPGRTVLHLGMDD